MSNIDIYEIDDQFDPLEDLRFDDDIEEEDEQRHEYLPPIPDAELSQIPESVPLPPEEAIERMIVGMPGQKQRILYAIQLCTSPRKLEEIAEAVDEAFPHPGVYESTQIVKLLEKAGALDATECEPEEGGNEEPVIEDTVEELDGDEEYLTVGTPPVYEYTATEEGLKAVENHIGEGRLVEVVTEEMRYLPLYRKILEMTSVEGGCSTKDLDAAIDPDPLCVEPKRFCGYFLDRLEETGAVKWFSAWVATESGIKLLNSDLFSNEERS